MRLKTFSRVALAVTAFAVRATADPAAEARFHDELARDHYAHGRYEAAVREFFFEQSLAANPRIVFNIALCFQQMRKTAEAFHFFSEYLSSADDDAERRSIANAAVQSMLPSVARLEVTSEPAGARIFVDKKEYGDYGPTPKTIAVPPGTHRIWAAMDGFEEASTTAEAKLGEQVATSLVLKRIVGKLLVKSARSGRAEIRNAEGRVVAEGAVPFEAELAPGSYEVQMSAPGALPWKGLANVRPGQQAGVQAEPDPLPKPTGDVTVTANVSGALIKLDEQPAGFSPTVIPGLGVGSHRIEIGGTNLAPWAGDVAVRPNERVWLTATLEPPQEIRRSPLTWVAGGLGLATLAGAGVVGLFARKAHADFESAPPEDQGMLRDRGETLNTAGDALLVGGVIATGLGVALYFLTEQAVGRSSSATVARSAR